MRNGRALSVRRPCRGMTIQSIFFQDSHEPVDCIRARRGCQHRRLSPLRGRRHAQGPSVRLGHLGLRQVRLCAEGERRRRARHLVGRHVEQLGGTGEDHVGGRKRSERAVSTGSARGGVGRGCEALVAPVLLSGAPSSDGRPPAGLPGALRQRKLWRTVARHASAPPARSVRRSASSTRGSNAGKNLAAGAAFRPNWRPRLRVPRHTGAAGQHPDPLRQPVLTRAPLAPCRSQRPACTWERCPVPR